MKPLPNAILGGKYRLELPLAVGGMGHVWKARQVDLGVPLAVKFMAEALASSHDARARFEREAKAAALLDSQHVVRMHDVGVEDDTAYIVMELLEGEDLAQRLKRLGRMEVRAVVPLLLQALKALRRAHDLGIVHRDLKPPNLFLAQKDDAELLKVLDFGIAKTANTVAGDATRTGTVLGSVHYMSPEQSRQSKLADPRSDLWAIGVIFYRAVTGRLPFPGEELGDVIVRICTETPLPPSKHVPTLPPSVDAFVTRALHKDREQRFQTALEMADALNDLLHEGERAVSDSSERPAAGPAGPERSSAVPTQVYVPPGSTTPISAFLNPPLPSPASPPTPVPASGPPVYPPYGSTGTLGPSAATPPPALPAPSRTPVMLALAGGIVSLAALSAGAYTWLYQEDTPTPAAPLPMPPPSAASESAELEDVPQAAAPLPEPSASVSETPAEPSAPVPEKPAAKAPPSRPATTAKPTPATTSSAPKPASTPKPKAPSDDPLDHM